jgi:hypothetical protein
MRWNRRYLAMLVALLVAFLPWVLAGCSEAEQRVDQAADELTNNAAAAAVQDLVTEELEKVGITLKEGPDCNPDLNRDGTTLSGKVNCTGTTTDDLDVVGDFSGSLSPSGCDGQLLVTVAGQPKVDLQAPTDCNVAS